MKAKEFLTKIGKPITHIDIVNDVIINIVVDSAGYGLSVDTKNILAGTTLTRTAEFTIENDTLTSGDFSLDLAKTDMLLQDVVVE